MGPQRTFPQIKSHVLELLWTLEATFRDVPSESLARCSDILQGRQYG